MQAIPVAPLQLADLTYEASNTPVVPYNHNIVVIVDYRSAAMAPSFEDATATEGASLSLGALLLHRADRNNLRVRGIGTLGVRLRLALHRRPALHVQLAAPYTGEPGSPQ
jgi:hypothetical protein